MSIQVMSWLIDDAPKSISSTELLVALMLANHCTRDGGNAYPSVETLARETHLSDRSVQRALQSLQQRGVIQVEQEATNRFPSCYCFPAFRGERVSPQESRGERVSPVGRTSVTSRGERVSPKPSIEPSIEPNVSNTTYSHPPARGAYTQEFEDFWKPYPATNGSKADAFKAWKQLTSEQRRAAIDALPAWIDCDRWREGFVKHAGSWLRGRMWEVAPVSGRTRSKNGVAHDVTYYDDEERRKADEVMRWQRERVKAPA